MTAWLRHQLVRPEHLAATAWVVALFGPPAVAAALIPARSWITGTNVALALVIVIVLVAATGRRGAAAAAALSSMVWFDFFHTRPYYSFTISRHEDVISAGLLLAVGLSVGELATRSRRHRSEAAEGSLEISRIHAMAELVATGESADLVVLAVATELRSLLGLRDCRFERHQGADARPLPRIEPSGAVTLGILSWGAANLGLPGKKVELPIIAHGRAFGRYLLTPSPGHPLTVERRVVAVTLADQAGSALAGQTGGWR